MKILFSLVLLALISCGGKGGGEWGVSSSTYTFQPKYGGKLVFNNLAAFKNAVQNDQWGQEFYFADYNYYEFKYRIPITPSDTTTGCRKSEFSIFIFNICVGQEEPKPIHTTVENKGVITDPLIPIPRIKEIVNKAELWLPGMTVTPSGAYAYFDGLRWIITMGTETFVFYTGYPLGANPIYYKNTAPNPDQEYILAKDVHYFIR